jgi:dTDP-4-amino-4,6-dideoxygalactose transaminase
MVQLKHLPDWTEARRKAAENYNKIFKDSGLVDEQVVLPIERNWAKHVYHLYVIKVLGGKRDALKSYLKDQGIDTGIHYLKPLHEQPCIIDYLKDNFNETVAGDSYPITNRVVKEILSLPIYPNISTENITQVVDAIKSFFGGQA